MSAAATVTELRPGAAAPHPAGCRCVGCELAPILEDLERRTAAIGHALHAPRLVKIPSAAVMLGVGKDLVYRLIRRHDLEAVRIDGCQLVVVESIDNYVAQLRRAGA